MKYLITLLCLLSFNAYAQSPEHFKKEVECLADNIYYEARGEGVEGWKAIASVTMNRYHSKQYPNTVCGVVYQKNQFSWTKGKYVKGNKHTPLYRDIKDISLKAYIGALKDNTDGALFYHNLSINVSSLGLIRPVVFTKKIGNHLFYKPKKKK